MQGVRTWWRNVTCSDGDKCRYTSVRWCHYLSPDFHNQFFKARNAGIAFFSEIFSYIRLAGIWLDTIRSTLYFPEWRSGLRYWVHNLCDRSTRVWTIPVTVLASKDGGSSGVRVCEKKSAYYSVIFELYVVFSSTKVSLFLVFSATVCQLWTNTTQNVTLWMDLFRFFRINGFFSAVSIYTIYIFIHLHLLRWNLYCIIPLAVSFDGAVVSFLTFNPLVPGSGRRRAAHPPVD